MTTLRIEYPDGGDFLNRSVCWNALNAASNQAHYFDMVDLSACVHLRPYTIACLVALTFRAGAGGGLRVVPPDDTSCREHLERLGLFDWFDGHPPEVVSLRSTNVPIQQITDGPGGFSDLAMTVWANEIDGLVAGLKPKLEDSLDEVILNALQHSESKTGCIVVGQAFPTKQKVEVCILDLGIGIPQHLRRSGRVGLSDANLIRVATEEGVTGARGSLNSGVGLYDLRTFIEGGGGAMTILSSGSYVVFRPGEPPFDAPFWGGFSGTLVNLQFDTSFDLPTPETEGIL